MRYKRIFSEHVKTELRAALQGDIDTLMQTGVVLKNDKTTTVVRVNIAGDDIIIKRYNARSAWHRVKRALRQSRAQRCWLMSQRFHQVGLHVAQPLAMVERRWGPFCSDAYFIAENVSGEELLAWLPQQTVAVQTQVSQQMQRVFALFQAHRLSHGDMKATNLLWQQDRVVMLDLDAAHAHQSHWFWLRCFRRDQKRFARNGQLFSSLIH